MRRKVVMNTQKDRRKLRVRKKVFGAKESPRLTVFRSNKYIYGQIIDDTVARTLVDVQAETKALHKGKDKSKAAKEAGKILAKKAKAKKIEVVIFDKGSYKYHGRVKSFAEGAREGGLKF